MVASYRWIRLTLLFVVTVVLATLGLGAMFPSSRQEFKNALSMRADADDTTADSCIPEKAAGSDDIYFLSCGGIY